MHRLHIDDHASYSVTWRPNEDTVCKFNGSVLSQSIVRGARDGNLNDQQAVIDYIALRLPVKAELISWSQITIRKESKSGR